MQIGELAKSCHVSVDTVRYYEKQALLMPEGRSEGGYRYYGAEAHNRLNFILQAKSLGFTLKEIKELLDIKVSPQEYECAEVKLLAEAKLDGIEKKIMELKAIHTALKSIADQCCGGKVPATECSILDAMSQLNKYDQ